MVKSTIFSLKRKIVKGQYPDCVRKVNSEGDMILKHGDDPDFLIPEDRIFLYYKDGTTFNLDDPYKQLNGRHWKLLSWLLQVVCKDANGNYLIDGTPDIVSNSNYGAKSRYGRAELYVERPGLEGTTEGYKSKIRASRLQTIFISMVTKIGLHFAKVLGRNMENQPVPDVEYFLISVAKKTPEKIIEICSGDLANRVLFITPKEAGVIPKEKGMYIYGEDGDFLILGASKKL